MLLSCYVFIRCWNVQNTEWWQIIYPSGLCILLKVWNVKTALCVGVVRVCVMNTSDSSSSSMPDMSKVTPMSLCCLNPTVRSRQWMKSPLFRISRRITLQLWLYESILYPPRLSLSTHPLLMSFRIKWIWAARNKQTGHSQILERGQPSCMLYALVDEKRDKTSSEDNSGFIRTKVEMERERERERGGLAGNPLSPCIEHS